MMDSVRITINWDPARGSKNRVRRMGHWSVEAEEQATARVYALDALCRANFPEFEHGVTLSFHVRRNGLMDRAAVIEGMKGIQDGLCNRKKNGVGLVPDDGPMFLDYGRITYEIAPRFKGRNVEVEITATPWAEDEVVLRCGVYAETDRPVSGPEAWVDGADRRPVRL